MYDISTKLAATIIIVAIAVVQCVAWALGYDGQVFAFTSAVIGALIGLTFGITINVKKSS